MVPPKKIHIMLCQTCQTKTLHAEDMVPDSKSATIWHCLNCGTERRPNEPGSPNEGAYPYRPILFV